MNFKSLAVLFILGSLVIGLALYAETLFDSSIRFMLATLGFVSLSNWFILNIPPFIGNVIIAPSVEEASKRYVYLKASNYYLAFLVALFFAIFEALLYATYNDPIMMMMGALPVTIDLHVLLLRMLPSLHILLFFVLLRFAFNRTGLIVVTILHGANNLIFWMSGMISYFPTFLDYHILSIASGIVWLTTIYLAKEPMFKLIRSFKIK